MASELDEKKLVIISLLDNLRPYNHSIGSYEKSIFTEDFDYSVKLSNGRIRLPEELVTDYEKNSSLITSDRYKAGAARFVPNEPLPFATQTLPKSSATQSYVEPEKNKKGSSSGMLLPIIVLAIVAAIGYYSYTSSQKSTARVNIYKLVSIEGNTPKGGLFGGIHDFKITLTNQSEYTLDIVKVKVSYIKQDGGLYKDEFLYFNRVNPHSTLTLDAPSSDRGTSLSSKIVSITCSALNI